MWWPGIVGTRWTLPASMSARWTASTFPRNSRKPIRARFYISPSECIDCGACEPECPWETIFEGDAVPDAFKEEDTVLNALCDSDRDNFEIATHTEKPRPTTDEVAENKKKWDL